MGWRDKQRGWGDKSNGNMVRQDVPIIGQPMTVVGWFPTVNVVCNCGQHQPLLIVGFNAPSVCPHCRNGYVLQAVAQDARTGQQPSFHVAIARAEQIEQVKVDKVDGLHIDRVDEEPAVEGVPV